MFSEIIFTYIPMLFWAIFFFIFVITLVRAIRLVPTKSAYIVERLGKYKKTLGPGFHALLPFLDSVTYIISLKEETIDVPPQECFTKDNVRVEVDGVMYIRVEAPERVAYGVTDYRLACSELAQTTTRSIIGTMDLDETFEERDQLSSRVVNVLNSAGQTWGTLVTRYEIKNIVPPQTVTEAMEKQVSAERERRAIIAESEGAMQSQIRKSEGQQAEIVNQSEGEKQRQINEAEGKSSEILALAQATAQSIEQVGQAINQGEFGAEAIEFELSQKYIDQLGRIAKEDSSILVPANVNNMDELLKTIGLKEG